jgi:hypothetical protein
VNLHLESDEESNYSYKLTAIDKKGAVNTMILGQNNPVRLYKHYESLTLEKMNSEEMITETTLEPNYPNPFNPSTNIQYQLSTQSDVSVEIYDTGGRRVAILVNQMQQPGVYTVQFDGSRLVSGIYFVRLQAGAFNHVQKLTLIK